VRRLLLILVAALALPATAHAALSGDGQRFAAWDADGVVHVLDDDGTPRDVAIPDGCRFAAVGGGRLLFDCSDGRVARAQVVDLATGAAVALPDRSEAEIGATLGEFAYDGIGTHWARIRAAGYHWVAWTYVPLAGGPTRRYSQVDMDPTPATRRLPDLDDPALTTTMCRPMRVPWASPEDGRRAQLLAGTLLLDRYDAWPRPGQKLTLQRCGRPERVVSTCPNSCNDATLGTTALAWIEREGRVVVQPLPAGRRHSWRPSSGAADLVLTGTRVVVHTRDGRVVSRPSAGGRGRP
jgi:hypothetical protein